MAVTVQVWSFASLLALLFVLFDQAQAQEYMAIDSQTNCDSSTGAILCPDGYSEISTEAECRTAYAAAKSQIDGVVSGTVTSGMIPENFRVMDASNAMNYCKTDNAYDKSKCLRGCFWYYQGDYGGGVWNTLDNVATQSNEKTSCRITADWSRVAFCKKQVPPAPAGAESCNGTFASGVLCSAPSITDCAGTYVQTTAGAYAQCAVVDTHCLTRTFCR